jgi:hypothetical protein
MAVLVVLVVRQNIVPRKPAKPVDKKARFAKLMGRYKHYDPSTEGYGSVDQWRSAWDQKMGTEEAQAALGVDDPLSILGLTTLPSAAELKRVYYKLCLQNQAWWQADASTEDQDKAKRLIAAYSLLSERAR